MPVPDNVLRESRRRAQVVPFETRLEYERRREMEKMYADLFAPKLAERTSSRVFKLLCTTCQHAWEAPIKHGCLHCLTPSNLVAVEDVTLVFAGEQSTLFPEDPQ